MIEPLRLDNVILHVPDVETAAVGTGLCAQTRDLWGNTVGFVDYSIVRPGGASG